MARTCSLSLALAAILFVGCSFAMPLSLTQISDNSTNIVSVELVESRVVDFCTALHEVLEADKQNAPAGFAELAVFIRSLAERYVELLIKEGDVQIPLLSFNIFKLKTRDGIELNTRNYVPFGFMKKFSTVFSRSPYSLFTSSLAFLTILDGHAVVTQDIRGTGRSSGYFDVWRQDSKDGYDTMSWIGSQSWSNGQVFSMGISADGCSAFTQWLESPKWLKGEWLTWYASNAHPTIYPGGAYRSNLMDNWMGFVCPECIADIKMNEGYNSYWAPVTGAGNYDKISGLTVNWGGWYDIFIESTINGFNGAQYEGSASVKGNNFLVVDSGGHCIRTYHPGGHSLLPIRLGFQSFDAIRSSEDYAKVSSQLKSSLGIEAINIFVMGPDVGGAVGNYWTSVSQWPATTDLSYFLQPNNYLSPVNVNGGSLSYAYDPKNPVPTLGGNELFGGCGPQDQSSLESRPDVLIFSSDNLRENIAITGAVRAILFVSSDAIDTDFTVKVTDVHPDGRSLLVMDNIVRLKWRDSNVTPSPITPGTIYEVEVLLGYTSYIFNTDHKIRVAVSSSNHPRFHANPNNGFPISNPTGTIIVARNTVYFDRANPSRVIFPRVDVQDIPENARLKEYSF